MRGYNIEFEFEVRDGSFKCLHTSSELRENFINEVVSFSFKGPKILALHNLSNYESIIFGTITNRDTHRTAIVQINLDPKGFAFLDIQLGCFGSKIFIIRDSTIISEKSESEFAPASDDDSDLSHIATPGLMISSDFKPLPEGVARLESTIASVMATEVHIPFTALGTSFTPPPTCAEEPCTTTVAARVTETLDSKLITTDSASLGR